MASVKITTELPFKKRSYQAILCFWPSEKLHSKLHLLIYAAKKGKRLTLSKNFLDVRISNSFIQGLDCSQVSLLINMGLTPNIGTIRHDWILINLFDSNFQQIFPS